MPPVIAAVTAIAGFIGAHAVAIATAIGGSLVSFGVSSLAGALSKKKSPSLASYSFADSAGGRVTVSKSSVESHKVIYGRVRVSGPLVYVSTTKQSVYVANVQDTVIKRNNLLHMIIPLACHEIEEIETIYLNEEALTLDGNGRATGKWTTVYPRDGGTSYHVTVKKYLGAPDQEADPDLIAAVPTEWTVNHRLRGLAYIYVKLRYYGYNTNVGQRDLFPSGVPNISAIVKGKKVYDPRTGLTAYSDNWALCMRDYLTDSDYGLGATDDEIDDDSVIAAANICDEEVAITGGVQARYTCNGQLDTANSPLENIKDLVSAGAGTVPYTQGKFRVFAGAYATPSAAVDETWLAGEIEVQAKTPRSDLFNAVKGVYIAPDKNWQPTDFPMVANATYEAQDGGIQIPRDLELPYTLDPVRAQRIAKIVLEKARQGIVAKFPCNWKALQLAIYDTVTVSIDKLGWSAKVFRVTAWELSPEGVINVTFQEESSASYDWNNGEATEYDPAPDTNLPEAGTVDAPGNPNVTETLYQTTDGSGLKTQAVLTWAESESPFISHYIVQYKRKDEEEEQYRQEPPIYGNQHIISDMAPGIWDFRVKAVNLRGVSSEYATTRREIYGLSAPPSDITGFQAIDVEGNVHLSWDAHPDLDVRNGGTIEIRFTYAFVDSQEWSSGYSIIKVPGNATSVNVPGRSGYYLAKAYDSTGHESMNSVSSLLFIANLLDYVQVAYTNDDINGYPGTLDGLYVEEDDYWFYVARLEPLGTFDDMAGNFDDALGYFDAGAGAGFVSEAEYIFVAPNDMSFVQRFRLSAYSLVQISDGVGYFDTADGLFNDREGNFDGGDLADFAYAFWVKTTSDDPTGSTPDDPIWSDWQPLTMAEFSARAFWFKFTAQNHKASNQLAVYAMASQFHKRFRNEQFPSKSLASGGSSIAYDEVFWDKPNVSVVIQSPTSGDTIKVTHTTSFGYYAGATVQILNGGVGVARTVDITVTGY